MSVIKIESTGITHIGLVRGNNEDNFFINGIYKSNNKGVAEGYVDNMQRDTYLYAVLDGMGGENYGEYASMIAAKSLVKYISSDIRRTIYEYIQNANKLICDEIIKNKGIRSGTTLALLYLRESKAFAYNIGDSRIYLCRNDDLYLLSEDHTEAQHLINTGRLDEESARHHKSKNILTQHLGIFPSEMKIEPFVSDEIKLKRNDMFMVCSDGLTDMVSDDDIREIMVRADLDVPGIAKELSATAQENGGNDNTTIIVVKVM